jgi:hypothetical protein
MIKTGFNDDSTGKNKEKFSGSGTSTHGNIPTRDLDGCNPLITRYPNAYLINFPSQLSPLNFSLAIG